MRVQGFYSFDSNGPIFRFTGNLTTAALLDRLEGNDGLEGYPRL
jgi:hypothetical protein